MVATPEAMLVAEQGMTHRPTTNRRASADPKEGARAVVVAVVVGVAGAVDAARGAPVLSRGGVILVEANA
jgi:hypothetical protein